VAGFGLEVITDADELVGHADVGRGLGEQRELQFVDGLGEDAGKVVTDAARRLKTERTQSQL